MMTSRFELRPARAWRWGVRLLSVFAGMASAAWAWTLIGRGETQLAWLALPLILLSAWAAGGGHGAGSVLRHEGGRWCFEAPGGGIAAVPGALDVAFDFGGWMLLRFRADGSRRSRWLAPSSRSMSDAWPAFRRAVYSPRPAPAGLSAQAPAAPSE